MSTRNQGALWAPVEEDFLRRHYAAKGGEWCAKQLCRGFGAVRCKARKMGLAAARRAPFQWTEKSRTYLRRHWLHQTHEQIAAHLGASVSAVRCMASVLGLPSKTRTPHLWRTGEVALLRAHSSVECPAWCAEQLRLPLRNVYQAAFRYGVGASADGKGARRRSK